MNIQGCIPRFLKAHGSLILTILSGLGLISTVAVTAKVAPQAEYAISDALIGKIGDEQARLIKEGAGSSEKCYDLALENTSLTFTEKIDAAGTYYIPVILLGLATMGCIAGAHILSVKQQASLLAAYGLLNQQFGAYREEIRGEYGDEADKKAYKASQEKVKNLTAEIEQLKKLKGYYTFAIATAPGLIFRANMAQIENAFLHFNRNLMLRGYGCVKELHDFIGLPVDNPLISPPTSPDEDYGWNEYMNQVNYECAMVDYVMEDVTANDGEIVHVIIPSIPPYRLDVEDENDLQDYEPYDISRTREMAKYGFADAPMQAEVDPEHYCENPGMFFG